MFTSVAGVSLLHAKADALGAAAWLEDSSGSQLSENEKELPQIDGNFDPPAAETSYIVVEKSEISNFKPLKTKPCCATKLVKHPDQFRLE